ncbi:phage terminase small subunit P27 family [Magnetospirillum molischianum]|uniref:Phage terminase small subunit P27 family n=1 Tax=Magnetospirillum molischianum DSM 120 TaxID=1150626 RepID=H8FUY5_MAGML|nr:phage terminase small subunit P27 family [Magnetospirillum molischianum]CCG42173.1 hypothetical protein PHAMO_340046 [Magnetospirillum molischianum DSM 120]
MARGRKADPAAVKEAKGNPGRRKTAAVADVSADLHTGAPPELSPGARKIWDALAPELARMKFLRETDRAAFARYCVYTAQWWDLTTSIAELGETYETVSAHGTMQRINPKFAVRERIENRLEALEDRFGLNPASRQQILQRMAGITPPPPPGGLFDRGQDGASSSEQAPQPAPSPIGLLGSHLLN